MPALLETPSRESARLEALHRYHHLDTLPEEAFNRVAQLASTFFSVPMAFVSFIDEELLFFKACHGVSLIEAPRSTSFCTHTIASDDVLVVPDALQDTRFCHLPFVVDEPRVRFYAGVPLKTSDGHNIGTVFIVDLVPRLRLTPEQCSVLESLAAMTMDALEAKREAHLAEANEQHLKHIIESTSDLIYTKDMEGRYTFLNRPPLGDEGPQIADIIGKTDLELYPESAEQFTHFDKQVLETQQSLLREETLYLNNQKIINHSHKKPFFTPEGELAGILGISRDITEETRIREELEQSLSLLQATFNATIDGLISVDLDYNVLGFNQRYVELWQLPPDLAEKKDARLYVDYIAQQLNHPEAFMLSTRRAQEKLEQTHQFSCSLKDGRWFDVISTPQYKEEQVIGRVISVRDVTQERQMRDKLEHSLTLLQATLEATTDGILSVDTNRKILISNGRYNAMRAVPQEIIDLQDDHALVDYVKQQHKDPDAWATLTEDTYRHPEKASSDIAEMQDGRVFERNSYPMRIGDKVIGRVWSFRDVTEQRQIQAALFESEAKLRAIIEASSDAIYTRDALGHYTFMNKAGASGLGYTVADIVGKTDLDFFPIKQALESQASDQQVIRENRRMTRTAALTIKGEQKLYRVEKVPLYSEGGVPTGIVGISRDITEASQNSRELERSLSLLKTTFDAINKGILNVGLDGTIHSFNQTYVDMWKVPDDVLDLRDDAALIAHARSQYRDPAKQIDQLNAILKDPEASFKDIGVLVDGRFIERTLTPQRLNGEVIGRVWTFKDITNEMLTEKALRDSEEKFRELAENIDDMFWLASSTLDETLYVSPAYEKIWGRSVEAAYSDAKDYLDAIHHADKARVLKAMEYMLDGDYDETYRIIHPDGSVRWVRDRAFPIHNDNGTVKRYAGVTQDISERVSFEQRLEESEKRTRTILESITDAFFSLDRKWRFTYINEQATSYLHRSGGLLGKNIWEALPEIESSTFYTRCHVAVSSGKAVLFEEYFPFLDTWFDIHIYPSAEGLSVYFHDISERKSQQKKLRQAKEEAEQANRAKSEFLSRMSHELRTPLNAILGFGQLLRLGDLSEEDDEAARDIVKAGEHLLELINEVLDIARIESGRMDLSLEPLCIAEALTEVLEMLRPLAQAVSLTVQANVPPQSYVKADWQRLKQVLLNLLSNAIKYNIEGGEIHVDFEVQDDRSVIVIRDTGVGIAPEMLPRVFDPFDRLGAETTSIEGTGIGLSLTKHLVELMGGAISVESTLGEGSTFRLELKRASAPALTQPNVTVKEVFAQQERDYKVVYIEDNLTNLKLVQRIFADMTNLELLSTVQGRIGLELAVQHVPDLILLDLHLPDMPGHEVLHQLRAEPLTQNIPVLVISADAMPERHKELVQAGASAYLSKPLILEEFTATVRSLLEHP